MLLGRSSAQRVDGPRTNGRQSAYRHFRMALCWLAWRFLPSETFAAKNFSSIEINGTHYCLQRPEYFAQWAAETPEDFVFAVKGSRFITHMKKLRGVEDALANFFAQGILCLGRKLGPVLWQFPPRFVFDPLRLETFFKMLPRTMKQAAQLAAAHGPKLHGRARTTVERGTTKQEIRHCVEIRHESRDIYVYFDNDMKVRAPFDAQSLSERVRRRLEQQTMI